MPIAHELRQLLEGRPVVGAPDQAFPFLTVDERGFPHSALLSRAEMDCDAERIYAVVASRVTKANLLRDGGAAFMAIGGTIAHHVKLGLQSSFESGRFLGCAFEVVSHKADTLGIPLEPMRFEATELVARIEAWDLTEDLLGRLAGGA